MAGGGEELLQAAVSASTVGSRCGARLVSRGLSTVSSSRVPARLASAVARVVPLPSSVSPVSSNCRVFSRISWARSGFRVDDVGAPGGHVAGTEVPAGGDASTSPRPGTLLVAVDEQGRTVTATAALDARGPEYPPNSLWITGRYPLE